MSVKTRPNAVSESSRQVTNYIFAPDPAAKNVSKLSATKVITAVVKLSVTVVI